METGRRSTTCGKYSATLRAIESAVNPSDQTVQFPTVFKSNNSQGRQRYAKEALHNQHALSAGHDQILCYTTRELTNYVANGDRRWQDRCT